MRSRSLFGPSWQDIWAQTAKEIGAEVVERGFWKPLALRCRHREWELLLDTYQRGTGSGSVIFTRMRAPFRNRGRLRAEIWREGVLAAIGKAFGMEDLEVGHRAFDRAFVIQGTQPEQVRSLLEDEAIRDLIEAQGGIRLGIRGGNDLWSPRYPRGTDVLISESRGALREAERIEQLFRLFTLVLERLVEIGVADAGDPGFRIRD